MTFDVTFHPPKLVSSFFIKLVISVSDTGIGIKKANIKTLFDSFTRVESGETRSIEGTGLGLSICKQLADLMNGELTVDSIYGKGSTFTLTLEQKVIDSAPIQNSLEIRQNMDHYLRLLRHIFLL